MNKQEGLGLWRETTIHTEPIFEGKMITLQVDTVQLEDGRTATREIVRHPGAAAVIALLDNKLLVVEQYRKPMDKYQIEIPAGKLDPSEDPIAAAARELEEETGYIAESLTKVNASYTSPGFADELLHLYFTDKVTEGQANPDEDEQLNVAAITLEEAEQYIAEGRISDIKTLMAIYVWKLYLLTGDIH